MNPVRNKNSKSSGTLSAGVSNGVKHTDPVRGRGPLRALAASNGTDTAGKKKLMRRLKIIEGQMRGLSAMIERDTYCIDIITQTSAVKQALSHVEDLLLETHLHSCVHRQMTSGQTGKAVGEVLKVYKLKRK